MSPSLRPGAAERSRRYVALVRSFVVKDIKTRYVGSLMGFLRYW